MRSVIGTLLVSKITSGMIYRNHRVLFQMSGLQGDGRAPEEVVYPPGFI